MNVEKMLITIMMESDIFEKHKDSVDWEDMSRSFRSLPDDFIKKYIGNLDWNIITSMIFQDTKYTGKSEIDENDYPFIEKYQDYLNWELISSLVYYGNITYIVEKYNEKIDLSSLKALTLSYLDTDVFLKYSHLFNEKSASISIGLRFSHDNVSFNINFIREIYKRDLVRVEDEKEVWERLSKYILLFPFDFVMEFQDKIRFEAIDYLLLEHVRGIDKEKFIETFKDKIDWKVFLKQVKITPEFIKKYFDYVYPYIKYIGTSESYRYYYKEEEKELKKTCKKEKIKKFIQKLMKGEE